jgi:16S rRNA (adenine1518-N6/adenine1519-N6)-dimethyltransferase
MNQLNYNSKSEIRRYLDERKLGLKKRFGQNFLINQNARTRLVSSLACTKDDIIWEIGPGLGALTSHLVDKARTVVAFEVDHGFIRALNELFASVNNLHILAGDVLDTWQEARLRFGEPDKIVGNLPYNSASSILAALAVGGCLSDCVVCTVQKELANRMTAKPGNRDYSSFSIFIQTTWSVTRIGELNPGSFYPQPRIVSSILKLEPAAKLNIKNKSFFFELVRASFQNRRKTLRNVLTSQYQALAKNSAHLTDILEEEGFGQDVRPEKLSPQNFILLANKLYSVIN